MRRPPVAVPLAVLVALALVGACGADDRAATDEARPATVHGAPAIGPPTELPLPSTTATAAASAGRPADPTPPRRCAWEPDDARCRASGWSCGLGEEACCGACSEEGTCCSARGQACSDELGHGCCGGLRCLPSCVCG